MWAKPSDIYGERVNHSVSQTHWFIYCSDSLLQWKVGCTFLAAVWALGLQMNDFSVSCHTATAFLKGLFRLFLSFCLSFFLSFCLSVSHSLSFSFFLSVSRSLSLSFWEGEGSSARANTSAAPQHTGTGNTHWDRAHVCACAVALSGDFFSYP